MSDEQKELEWRLMFNARRLIKRTTMSNKELFSELFGTGMQTAITRCKAIGLDPDDNKVHI